MGIVIEVRNGNIEKAMRILKRKVQKDGLINDLRDKQYYKKPSEKKREKSKERAKLLKKVQRDNDELMGYRWIKGVKVKKI